MSHNQILFSSSESFYRDSVAAHCKMIINKREVNSDFLIFSFITAFACLLQYTRIWDTNLPSDWYAMSYWGLFQQISKESFYEYVFKADKEPVWRLLNYIVYYLTEIIKYFPEIRMGYYCFLFYPIFIYI